MTDHVADRAGFLAALSAEDPERRLALAHARSCAACRAALDEGARRVALLKDAALSPVPTHGLLAHGAAAMKGEPTDRRRPFRKLSWVAAESSIGLRGTAFAKPSRSSPSLGLELRPPRAWCPLRILLAEHGRNMRTLLGLILRREGHAVVEANDGARLLEEMASAIVDGGRAPFDLIISEHRLPGITGLSVLSGLREQRLATRFILITDSVDVQAQARQLGASVLDKPFNTATIRTAISDTARAT